MKFLLVVLKKLFSRGEAINKYIKTSYIELFIVLKKHFCLYIVLIYIFFLLNFSFMLLQNWLSTGMTNIGSLSTGYLKINSSVFILICFNSVLCCNNKNKLCSPFFIKTY